jgi:hypothetical protein
MTKKWMEMSKTERDERRAYDRNYYRSHCDRKRVYNKNYRQEHREQLRKSRACRKVGLDPAAVPDIPDICDFCHLPFGPKRRDIPTLDHDHETRAFRGWVHLRCNAAYIGANTRRSIQQLVEYWDNMENRISSSPSLRTPLGSVEILARNEGKQ